MPRVIGLIIACFLGLCGSVWAEDYTITFSSNSDQEAILLALIHDECASLLSSSQAIPGYCSQNAPPDDQSCTCTPSNAQKRNFLASHYLAAGFVKDRNALYRSQGAEIGRLFPTLGKAERDACSTAAGLPLLP